jgi:hypothetical protein
VPNSCLKGLNQFSVFGNLQPALCEMFLGKTLRFLVLRLSWNLFTWILLSHTAFFKVCWQCLTIWWLAGRFMLVSLSPGSSCFQSVLHILAGLTLLETWLASCHCPTQKFVVALSFLQEQVQMPLLDLEDFHNRSHPLSIQSDLLPPSAKTFSYFPS